MSSHAQELADLSKPWQYVQHSLFLLGFSLTTIDYCQPAVSQIDVYVTVTLNVATDLYLITIPGPVRHIIPSCLYPANEVDALESPSALVGEAGTSCPFQRRYLRHGCWDSALRVDCHGKRSAIPHEACV